MVLQEHVGHQEASARPEYSKDLSHHLGFIEAKIEDSVGHRHIDGGALQRQGLQISKPELHVG
jgi:hypothetical protein